MIGRRRRQRSERSPASGTKSSAPSMLADMKRCCSNSPSPG